MKINIYITAIISLALTTLLGYLLLPLLLISVAADDFASLLSDCCAAAALLGERGFPIGLCILCRGDDSAGLADLARRLLEEIPCTADGIFPCSVLDAAALPDSLRSTLEASARLILTDSRELLPQLRAMTRPLRDHPLPAPEPVAAPEAAPLLFGDASGGFHPNTREYVHLAAPEDAAPAAWTRMVADRRFGTRVSAEGPLASFAGPMLSQTMNTYLFLDYFKDAKALSAVNLVSVGGMLLTAPFASKISRVVGKKEAGSIAVLIAAIVHIVLFFLRIKTISTFMIFLFLGMTGMGFFNMITWAFITDVIDHQEVMTGSREDGTVYAVYSFARKVGQALAGGIGGFALTAIGYVSEASSQTEQVADRIYTVATLIPGICYLIVYLIMQFGYTLNRRTVEHNTKVLQGRRDSSVQAQEPDNLV